jgi:hypothetical protein
MLTDHDQIKGSNAIQLRIRFLGNQRIIIAFGQLITATGVPSNTTIATIVANSAATTATGSSGAITIVVTSATGILRNQLVIGTGIAAGATVVSVVGTTVTLSSTNVGAVSGAVSFSGNTITMTAAATATAIVSANFQSVPNRITLWQHEIGTDQVIGDTTNAIESSFQTSDLGWVAGGPSQSSPVGDNYWLHLVSSIIRSLFFFAISFILSKSEDKPST